MVCHVTEPSMHFQLKIYCSSFRDFFGTSFPSFYGEILLNLRIFSGTVYHGN